MLSLSKPKSAGAAQDYFRDQYAANDEAYYSQGGNVTGEWQGQLADELGLTGQVKQADFARLSEGQHPTTGAQLVQHRASVEYTDADGKTVKTAEHRAGTDATLSAPKSVSLTALVGGDERVTAAHRMAVTKALYELERYTDARMPGDQVERTGKFAAAKFEHDTSRPVAGYQAPQLHTHCFVMNVTQTADGKTRALQTAEMFNARQYVTSVYRAELAAGIEALGYQIERGDFGKFEIKGYTDEYLRAESPRSQQIKEAAAERGLGGAKAAGLIALELREKKLDLTQDQVREMQQQHAAQYGYQPQAVVEAARSRQHTVTVPTADEVHRAARQAVSYATEHMSERSAAFSERALLKTALDHGQGQVKTDEVRAALIQSIARGEIIRRDDRRLTTREGQQQERQNIERLIAGRDKCTPLADERQQAEAFKNVERSEKLTLSQDQRQAAQHITSSRDRFTALEGVAGAGKTTTLAAIREAAELAGYEVKGLAPTSRAAGTLADAGMKTETLQKHLAAGSQGSGLPRLLVLDESSLASSKQIHAFMDGLAPQDRVLFVGDQRQHESVEAGRPFAQLKEAGMSTAQLNEIRRQKDPALKEAVQNLANGKTKEAVEQLIGQGRVQQIIDRGERVQAIARDYADRPEKALVVSPDNTSRREINQAIRAELQQRGTVDTRERVTTVLEARDLTGGDRKHAQYYRPGDVVRYSRKSQEFAAGETARVVATDAKRNTVTVEKEGGRRTTYDPRRLQGVQVYREAERTFAVGDRVQTTAPLKSQALAGRELGSIQKIDRRREFILKMDSGRTVKLDKEATRHLDHGYAVTSFSSQGQTARRVLIHADTTKSAELLNQRMAYVSISRAAYDARIYTDDAAKLGAAMSRDRSHSQALLRPLHWQERKDEQQRDQGAAAKPPQRPAGVEQLRNQLGLNKPGAARSAGQGRAAGLEQLHKQLGPMPASNKGAAHGVEQIGNAVASLASAALSAGGGCVATGGGAKHAGFQFEDGGEKEGPIAKWIRNFLAGMGKDTGYTTTQLGNKQQPARGRGHDFGAGR